MLPLRALAGPVGAAPPVVDVVADEHDPADRLWAPGPGIAR
jgi:hypothetical protein